ncbi:uncharacterized protein LOC62_04G005322 [Vanrija pseudolonga]|uniref:F-box domain-containing protein n=1 Tax=Vanrija pseudolonga TaxID=143232 RepID=A0AAF0YBQ3_9TREE|nr:hypothetical protein LOC62_04G005322 [Vanrija pseudolonga]
MPTLDHTAYPFIMEQVLMYASVQALFKLRLTSKSFRARVDNILATHVFLDGGIVDNEVKTAMLLPKAYRFYPGPSTWALTAPHSSVLVVDAVRKNLGNQSLADTFNTFAAVNTLRRFWPLEEGEYDAIDAYPKAHPSSNKTLVDFIPVTQASPHRFIALPTAPRQIIHLHVGRGAVNTSFHNIDRPALTDIVLILWSPAPTGEEPENVALDNGVDLRFLTAEEWWEELEEGEKELIGVWPSEYYDELSTSEG